MKKLSDGKKKPHAYLMLVERNSFNFAIRLKNNTNYILFDQ